MDLTLSVASATIVLSTKVGNKNTNRKKQK